MLVGKDTKNVMSSDFHVDSWKREYVENFETGEDILKETFDGQVKIESTNEQKYLGFWLSRTGDNTVNIRQMKNKSIGIIKQTFNRLKSLNLQKYYLHELHAKEQHTICCRYIL